MDVAAIKRKELGPDERRERRRLRREKQRIENIERADQMHIARLAGTSAERGHTVSDLEASIYVGHMLGKSWQILAGPSMTHQQLTRLSMVLGMGYHL